MTDLKDIAKIPATGDDVQRRFHYQNLYTILLGIQMYRKEIPYEKLFCEFADDVLAVLPNKKLVAIQIKTTESKSKFSYNDPAVVKSIGRFINLNILFLNSFSEFIFVSNVGFGKDKDLDAIIEDVKNKDAKSFNNNTKKFIKKIAEEFDFEYTIIINTLKKIKTQKGPSLDDIESKIKTDYLSKIEHCSSLSVPQLSSILDLLVLEIHKKATKHVEDSLKDFIAFVDDGGKKQLKKEIEAKQILPETIEQITKNQKTVYLVSNTPASLQLKTGGIELMEQKMAAGGIGMMEVDSMRNLALSTHTYFLEEYDKSNGEAEEIKRKIDQIQVILGNEAAEAETETKKKDSQYGIEMLKSIEKRIRGLANERHDDVFGIKYEILKGSVGIMAGDCRIWFNDRTTGETN